MPESINANDLRVVTGEGRFYIQASNDVLRTPDGEAIESGSPLLLEQIIADFNGEDIVLEDGIVQGPQVLNAYLLHSMADGIEKGDNPFENLLTWLSSDAIFSPTSENPVINTIQLDSQLKAEQFLEEKGIKLRTWGNYEPEEEDVIINLFYELLDGLSAPEKAVLYNLAILHNQYNAFGGELVNSITGAQFVNTFVYLLGFYNEDEYAAAVFSRSPDVSLAAGDEPDSLSEEERRLKIGDIVEYYKNNCLAARRYLEAVGEVRM